VILRPDNYKSVLHEGYCMVKFIKKNGDERIFEKATLKEDLIPAEATPTGSGKEFGNPDIIRVYTEDGWRSFDINSVLEFKRID